MFRIANPESRFPAYLQPYTKENFIAQIAVAGVYLGVMAASDYYSVRKNKKFHTEES